MLDWRNLQLEALYHFDRLIVILDEVIE